MKRYVKNNTVFMVSQIRKENLTMSIPDGADLSAMGYEFLVETPMPVQDGFYAVEVSPINNVQTWELKANEVVIPQTIRMAQCRAQLIIDGKDDDVEMLLSGISDPIKQKLYRAYFEYEPIVTRDNPMINEMAPVLGIDLDVFFMDASKL